MAESTRIGPFRRADNSSRLPSNSDRGDGDFRGSGDRIWEKIVLASGGRGRILEQYQGHFPGAHDHTRHTRVVSIESYTLSLDDEAFGLRPGNRSESVECDRGSARATQNFG